MIPPHSDILLIHHIVKREGVSTEGKPETHSARELSDQLLTPLNRLCIYTVLTI